MEPLSSSDTEVIKALHDHITSILINPPNTPLPFSSSITTSTSHIHSKIPKQGLGLEPTISHIISSLSPGFNNSSLSPNYYGFVTGGITPAAQLADNLVTLYDQNVQVHLPAESISTVIEEKALCMLLELFNLDGDEWQGRTFTTGATAGNILGLACGREFVLQNALEKLGKGSSVSVGDDGLVKACLEAGIEEINVLSVLGHSSLKKAASVVGLGRGCVKDVGRVDGEFWFDLELLEGWLKKDKALSIVVISCGEVNTGGFATHSVEDVKTIRELCDKYGAWLHVDGAFGLFARALPDVPEFSRVRAGCAGLELVDSITGDGHKLLNVPYDCGFFFSRHKSLASRVFQNPNAAYLSSSANADIPSPLNIGMENSRRFRGLPVYATLLAYGQEGYVDMLQRQVRFAREVARWIMRDDRFEVLPSGEITDDIFIIVLFSAKSDGLNNDLVRRINETREIYVSGTSWHGRPAARIAVSNWQVEVSRDFNRVRGVLESIASV